MLFCVTTCGRDRIFSKPRLSAALRMKSSLKFAVNVLIPNPLVELVEGRLENKGIAPGVLLLPRRFPVVGPIVIVCVAGGGSVIDVGGTTPVVMIGLSPFPGLPKRMLCPLAKPTANCVPISRAKVRVE